jgi:putative restriction endonuclease
MSAEPYIAIADPRGYKFFMGRLGGEGGVIDEVNFWSPKARRRLKAMALGTPVFLRLPRPYHALVGYGFFAHFVVLDLREAWNMFEWRNGDATEPEFLRRLGSFRGVDLLDPRAPREAIGCTILRDVRYWPRERWLPWGDAEGWKANTVQGATEREPARGQRLLARIAEDGLRCPDDLKSGRSFEPVGEDATGALRVVAARVGQGTFRARLLSAYDGRCAISGERIQPVLDAAHIQAYRGPASNHVQNGLLLTKDLHALFDAGYLGIEPKARTVVVSERLREDWHNGKRFYALRGAPLRQPANESHRASAYALSWHLETTFLGKVA